MGATLAPFGNLEKNDILCKMVDPFGSETQNVNNSKVKGFITYVTITSEYKCECKHYRGQSTRVGNVAICLCAPV